MSPKLRVAVLGVGRWGYNLVRTLADIESCELVAICDTNLQRAKAIAFEFGISVASEFVEGDADALVIATPPETHARQARLAVESGMHVFVEKPLATSLADGLELEQVATRSQKLVMAGHLLRYHEGVACLRRLVTAGELGTIEFSVSRRLGWRAADRCGPWWSLAPHDLSVLRGCLASEPVKIAAAAALEAPTSWNPMRALLGGSAASARPARCPIRVTACCEFAGGVKSLIDVGLLDQSKMRRVVVVGRRAMARFDDGDGGGVWIKPTPKAVHFPEMPTGAQSFTIEDADKIVNLVEDLSDHGEPWTLVESNWTEPLALEMRQFVAACQNPKLARIEMEDALAILRALEAGTRSMRDGGRTVRVPGKSRSTDVDQDAPTSSPDW